MRVFFFWACVLSFAGNFVYSSGDETLNQRLWDELALATGKSSTPKSSPAKKDHSQDQITTQQSAPARPKLEIPHRPKRKLLRQR